MSKVQGVSNLVEIREQLHDVNRWVKLQAWVLSKDMIWLNQTQSPQNTVFPNFLITAKRSIIDTANPISRKSEFHEQSKYVWISMLSYLGYKSYIVGCKHATLCMWKTKLTYLIQNLVPNITAFCVLVL